MCDFVKNGAEPDLVFYYSIDVGTTNNIYERPILTYTVSQRPIFSDESLTEEIGSFMFAALEGSALNNNTYTFILNNVPGGFCCSHINFSANQSQSTDGLINPNSSLVANIYTGNDSFLNASGFIIIKTNDTNTRKVFVYFTKCKGTIPNKPIIDENAMTDSRPTPISTPTPTPTPTPLPPCPTPHTSCPSINNKKNVAKPLQ